MYKRQSHPVSGLHVDGFDWDAGNSGKCQGHGLTLPEVESIFDHEPLVGPDPFDPLVERRWRAIGRTASGRAAFVVFTIRSSAGRKLIRPLSARYMHAKEALKYDQIKG